VEIIFQPLFERAADRRLLRRAGEQIEHQPDDPSPTS